MEFRFIGGYAFSLEQIQFADLRNPDIAIVHIGSNSLTFTGAEAAEFREMIGAPKAETAEVVTEEKPKKRASKE